MTMTIEDLSRVELQELLDRTLRPTDRDTRDRRREHHARWLAMRERSASLVRERIAETFHDPLITAEVQRWATSIFNPVRRLSELSAKVYSTPPIRGVAGIGAEQERDYLRMLKRLRFNARAKSWNQWQVALNTIVVLVRPAVDAATGDPTLDFFHVTGASGEIIAEPGSPRGDTPGILAYTIDPSGDISDMSLNAAMRGEINPEVMATVDSRWWTFFDASGNPVRSVEHGLGRFPGAQLQIAEQEGDTINDFWNPDFGRSTVEALREAGLVGAIMGWARKSGFGKLVALVRGEDDHPDDEGEADQTMGQPESILQLTGQDLRVEDLEVRIAQFREHMGLMLQEAARAVTGTASILEEPAAGQTQSDTAQVHRHEALKQYQQDAIVYLDPFEQRLQEVMAAFGTAIGMKGAVDPLAVADGFEAAFQPLLFLDTPQQRLNTAIAGTKFGTDSPQAFLQRERGISLAEANRLALRMVEEAARLHDVQASRNQSLGAMDDEQQDQEIRPELPGEGLAERQGRQGGRASPA